MNYMILTYFRYKVHLDNCINNKTYCILKIMKTVHKMNRNIRISLEGLEKV